MELLTVICSGIAAIGSIVSVFVSLRQGYAAIISNKRFDWMNVVRSKISQFLEVFYDKEISTEDKLKKLTMKMHEVNLYLDTRVSPGYDNTDQVAIAEALKLCINSINDEAADQADCINILINSVQICMANTHSKAKSEADSLKKHF